MSPDRQLLEAVQIAIGPVDKMLDALLVLEKNLLTSPKNHVTLRKLAAGVEAKSVPEAQASFAFEVPLAVYEKEGLI